MTPKKLRPLRELRRLRRLGDQAEQETIHGQRSSDTASNGSSYLWPIEGVLIESRTIVDIQVLAEAGHSSGATDPRPGFVAVVDQSGAMSSVERIRGNSRDLRSSAKRVAQALSRYTFGTPILGLIDQPKATNPARDIIDEVDRELSGTTLSGKFIVLCHSAVPNSAGSSTDMGQSNVVRVGSNHVGWSSWNESHELAAMTVGSDPVKIELV